MSIYKELSYDRDIDVVKGIRFCILSPEEILRMSVAEITKTDTYISNEPQLNGLYDPRMGVLDHNKVCQTCEQKNTFCPGHFGHIKLVRPVFYFQFFDMVKKILKCVCFKCSHMLANIDSDEVRAVLSKKYSRQKRWEIMYKMCSKVKKCPCCGAKQPDKISREPIVKVVMEWKDVEDPALKKIVMMAEDVHTILKRISDRECDALGFSPKFSRPEWMICTVLPVPPPAVRPSVKADTGQRSEDDLTHKLCDIVKANKLLQSRVDKGVSKEQIDIAAQVLQYHVATFIDNQIPGINPAQQRTGRLIKSLSERLKGKEGRIRGNLMGKRVDFSARSVITPDPNISIDELGVPIKIAMNLTFPEIVNRYNKDKLMELVKNGPDVYPGAKFIRKPGMNNRTFRLKNIDRETIDLEVGDIVERHLMDGDYVLFNRQPSLHRHSMLAHRVRVVPYNTFRLNLCVCKCYNADMDGDEMNMHVPQSLVTANELREIAAVPQQIMSPRECKPIISIVQDTALGVYRMTKGHVFMNDKQYFNLMARNTRFFGELPKHAKEIDGVRYWSGRQVLSSIIPKNINLKSANRSFDENKPEDDKKENFVVIENGEIVQGRIDTGIYQNRTKGLIHSIYSECGPEETRHFLDNTQTMICDYLVNSGFSVGISDLIVDEDTKANLKKVIHDMKVKVYDVIKDIHVGHFENKSIENNNDYFESQINQLLNKANTESGKFGMSKIDDNANRMINMVKSGSKGNVINVAQMLACLGQQNVDGKRIVYGFDSRTLPHYTKYDDGPESRGFVENSFVKGLTPQEFFFHAMGGREGLIDTAVKSVTGDTPIIIIEDGKPKYVRIGDWIDAHLENAKGEVEHHEERQLELLNMKNPIYIPTTDYQGNVTWGPVSAITRHDPGTELYEIKTAGGKKVIVTESKSLLTWNKELKQFKEVPTPEIKVGDFVPVTANLCEPPIIVRNVDLDGQIVDLSKEFGIENAIKLVNDAPEFVYIAPLNFIESVVETYINQMGIIENGKLIIKVASQKSNDVFTMMCTRLGVGVKSVEGFIEMSKNNIKNLHTRLNLVIDMDLITSDSYTEEYNDVVMDPITEINVIGIEKYPKVYDLTIPTTFNFGLANGLQVRDTSSTGYLQRKLVKAMEDCKVAHDHTVRNASGAIVQFLYGEDGMDPTKIESQPLQYIDMDYDNLVKSYLIASEDELKYILRDDIIADMKSVKNWQERLKANFDQVLADREFMIEKIFKGKKETSIMYPVSFMRIINTAKAIFGKKGSNIMSDLNPMYVLDKIDRLCEDLRVGNKEQKNKFIQILIRCYLSPKQIISYHKFDQIIFDYIVDQVKQRFFESINDASEMVGVCAAQSIGEPATQLVLNTFHSSGVSSASKAVRGVPRVEELLSVSRNQKAPSLNVFLSPSINQDKHKAKAVMNTIQTTVFGDIVKSSRIYYDPNDFDTTIESDREFVRSYQDFIESNIISSAPTSPWLLRFELDKEKMLDYNITMMDIHLVMQEHYDDNVSVMFSDDNSQQLIFRIKLASMIENPKKKKAQADDEESQERDYITELKALEKSMMESLIIKGFKKISKAAMDKMEYMKYNKSTMTFEKTFEWMINTAGTNLIEILGHPDVDPYRTFSNDIIEIYEIFGIEAARAALYNEINSVISDGNLYINYRHIALLVDTMTNRGYLLSINRHGINRVDVGPLAKCSFEEVTDMITKAGMFAEIDRCTGISANVMLGQVPPCGTGDSQILIDEDKLLKIATEDYALEAEHTMTQEEVDDACRLDNLTFDFTMPDPSAIQIPKIVTPKIKIV